MTESAQQSKRFDNSFMEIKSVSNTIYNRDIHNQHGIGLNKNGLQSSFFKGGRRPCVFQVQRLDASSTASQSKRWTANPSIRAPYVSRWMRPDVLPHSFSPPFHHTPRVQPEPGGLWASAAIKRPKTRAENPRRLEERPLLSRDGRGMGLGFSMILERAPRKWDGGVRNE